MAALAAPFRLIWELACRAPVLMALAAIALQAAWAIDTRALWYSDELRYAEATRALLADGQWIVLSLNGVPYPDKPPLWFWMLAGLERAFGLGLPATLWLGSAVSMVMLLAASDLLARALDLSREVRGAAMLVLLSSVLILGLVHYIRMDMLFAALILLAMAGFWRHYGDHGPGWLAVAGFFAAGLAIITKGPLGLLVPLVPLVLYLIWSGGMGRLFTRVTLWGLLAAALPVVAWLAAVAVVAGPAFLTERLIGEQVVARGTDAFHHKEPWHYYVRMLPILALPWAALVVAAPGRAFDPRAWGTVWAGRRQAGAVAFLVLGVLGIFALLSALSGKVAIYVLPMLPMLALLAGLALTSGAKGIARGMVAVGVALLLLAAGMAWLALAGSTPVPWGELTLGAGLLIQAGTIGIAYPRAPTLALPALAVVMGTWATLQALLTLPYLDSVLSTRTPATILRDQAAAGAHPVAYRTYSGVYSFYAGRAVDEIATPEDLAARLAAHDTVVIAGRARHLDGLPGLEGAEELDRREIWGAGGTYLVLRVTGQAGQPPAQPAEIAPVVVTPSP
ncbi:MAG: phospholipid carrier-dependent glycosyltransferase [Rhodobacteraceae bacterium]|jgi:4-amino-4-deoxy-L-arabinose transferase-like glycosyltransferase|nr:phospholipid carrier-dependent glycosyltransferase [Paracoccaceae bacterium]